MQPFQVKGRYLNLFKISGKSLKNFTVLGLTIWFIFQFALVTLILSGMALKTITTKYGKSIGNSCWKVLEGNWDGPEVGLLLLRERKQKWCYSSILAIFSKGIFQFSINGNRAKAENGWFYRNELGTRKMDTTWEKKFHHEETSEKLVQKSPCKFLSVVGWFLSNVYIEQDSKKTGRKQCLKAKQVSSDLKYTMLGRQISTSRHSGWKGPVEFQVPPVPQKGHI